MANEVSPSTGRRTDALPYEADPYQARTDLLLDGFWFAKIVCAAGLYFAIMFAAARLSSWILPLLSGAGFAAALVAIDRLQNWVAIRRGRPGRSLADFGVQAARIVRRFWFMPLIPLLDHRDLPLLVRIALTAVAIFAVEAALAQLDKSGILPPWLNLAAGARGTPDTASGKGAAPP